MSYKHDFVDRYPYLAYTDAPNKTDADVFGVYSDNPEAADDDGGGGADLGELYTLHYFFDDVPTVGDLWSNDNLVQSVATSVGVGASPLFDMNYDAGLYAELPNIAGGATLKTMWFTSAEMYDYDSIYTITVKTDGRDQTVGAVVNLNVTATTETETVEDETATRYAFTVPPKPVAADIPLAEGESIYGVFNIVHMSPEGEGGGGLG